MVGCAPAAVVTRVETSAWGIIFTVGQAEQLDAPAVVMDGNRITAAWIGADKTGVHQDIRAFNNGTWSERVVLPLPPVHPYAQQLFSGDAGYNHLLWLDADAAGETRLYAALITPTLTVDRGPTVVTAERTTRYTALRSDDGSLWTVSSGGLLAEPGLYAHLVDAAGRPRIENSYQIAFDADWPLFVAASDGSTNLLWLRASDGRVMAAQFVNGQAKNAHPLAVSPPLNPGDRLMNFSAGTEGSRIYLLWNVTRVDGQTETWFTSGFLNASDWELPLRFGLDTSSTAAFETGFNGGPGLVAQAGDQWISWASPLPGVFDKLALAAVINQQLTMIYLRDGAVIGYQTLAPVQEILRPPNIIADRDRHLLLAWSEPTLNGYADLKLTTTRR
jgi:hypothetical protein